MSVTTVKDFISKQNVKKLAEDIVLGPQAEVLTLIEQFNNRWRSNIAITKSFRWKPGTHPNYKERISEYLNLNKRCNSLARVHWRVSDHIYGLERMGRQIHEIEDKLYHLRNNDLMFQDNTEYVEKALSNILNTAEESKDIWSMNIIDTNGHRQLQIYTLIQPEYIKVRLGEEIIQEIPTPPISLHFSITFDSFLNTHSKIASGHKGAVKIRLNGSGMLLDNDDHVLHPYVSSGGGYGQTRRPSTDYVHTCFGDLTNQIFHAIYTLDWKNADWLLNRWASNYTINITNPLNNIKTAYHGKPSYLTEKYMDVVGHSENDCAYPNIFKSNIMEEIYCDKVNCLLRENCTFYNLEINISLSGEDEAALYNIAEAYYSMNLEESAICANVMPSTIEQYYMKIYNIWTRYRRDDKLSYKTIYESMLYIDEGLKELFRDYSNSMKEITERYNGTWRTVNFNTDMSYPIIAYWTLCPSDDYDNWLPYIREGFDIDIEKKRINRAYARMFDDLIEHLENNDALDMEPIFKYPYPAITKEKPIVVQERQEPIITEWAEYLANNNLRSIGGQNE